MGDPGGRVSDLEIGHVSRVGLACDEAKRFGEMDRFGIHCSLDSVAFTGV